MNDTVGNFQKLMFQMMKVQKLILPLFASLLTVCVNLKADEPIELELSPKTLLVHYCSVTPETFKGKEAIHIKNTPANPDGPVALVKGIEFEDGIIEVDIASERFAGIAFRSQNGDHYDKVYFRPFNSGTAKHKNTVQYAVVGNRSLGWNSLRRNFPGTFESGADVPVMEWFHVKLIIKGNQVSVFVNDAEKPVLVVNQTLSGLRKGGIGIWGWNAYFANLKYTPTEPAPRRFRE
jgi:hypothetical protein